MDDKFFWGESFRDSRLKHRAQCMNQTMQMGARGNPGTYQQPGRAARVFRVKDGVIFLSARV